MRLTVLIVVLGWSSLITELRAQEDAAAEKDKPLALQPQPRSEDWWQERHKQKLKERESMDQVDLLLICDSITHSWENGGKQVWQEHFGDYHTLNIGYSGDRTEHVIWRLQNGEVEDIAPKAAVVMIGTNNTGHRQDKPEDIAAGIRKILDELRTRLPETPILLLAIFPRDAEPDGAGRQINDAANELIREFADGEHIHFLNINDRFLDENGHLPASVMPDRLHPNAQGYRIWAESMKDKIADLVD